MRRTLLTWPPRVLMAVAALPLAAALRYVDPAVSGLFPPCVIHSLTGWYCSGCGTARALHELSHGHLLGALQLNALAVLILSAVALALVDTRLDVFARLSARGIWILLAVIAVFGLARNIPAYPFLLLAPR